jgi:Tol biopolymer transport system component
VKSLTVRRGIVWLAAAAAVAPIALPAHAYPRPGTTERVSVASGGGQGAGDAVTTISPAISADGRYIAFSSTSSTLVAGDTNNAPDVFVHDRRTGRTARASVGTGGVQGVALPALCGVPLDGTSPEGSSEPAISADGRYVAFSSCFANLVRGDTNAVPDVFVRDMRMGTTTRVSVGPAGVQANGASGSASLSGNGSRVSFESYAKNLDPSKVCGSATEQQVLCATAPVTVGGGRQVYVRDLAHGWTRAVSVSSSGEISDGQSAAAAMSPDGRYAVFTSEGDNLVANDSNRCVIGIFNRQGYPSCDDVYLHDLQTGKTQLVSVGLDGKAAVSYLNSGTGASGGHYDAEVMSADDRYVAFRSNDDNLVPNALNHSGVYLWDRLTGRIRRASVDSDGTVIDTGQNSFSFSRDGRYVAMDNLPNPCPNAYLSVAGVHDLFASTTTPLYSSAASCSAPNVGMVISGEPVISNLGRDVAFWSNASNLVAGDTNAKADVFVRDRGVALGVGDLAVGGLVGSGRLVVAGARDFSRTGSVARADIAGDVSTASATRGLDLIGATLTYRPSLGDMFVRLETQHMPLFALADPSVVYALDLTVGGTAYELRIGKAGADASFSLFRAGSTGWTHVADLKGGYGTTGQEVVAAIPLATLGASHGAQLSDVNAVAGIGSVATGIVDPIDAVRL